MTKRSTLDRLFDEWKRHYKKNNIPPDKFSPDGIIDDDYYKEASRKVLFILRETNDFPEDDLRDYFKAGPKGNIGHQIAQWAAGIINNFPPFEEVNTNFELQKKSIRSIALLNLKKYTGGSTTDFNLLNAYALLDRDFIVKEIDIIDPEFIVCCNTFIEFMWVAKIKVNLSQNDNAFERLYNYGNSKVIIWLNHPANRKRHAENYNGLKKLFQDLGLS